MMNMDGLVKTPFFNEGGCYAKVINLSEESEPDILELLKGPF
jgi:ATP-dependent phosphoenolpyruvate carboxykinase